MNIAIFAAALLMGLTTLIHVFMGGPEVMTPTRASDLSRLVRAVLDVVWHGITVVLACLAAALLWLAFHDNMALLWLVCAIQIGFAALFLWYGARQLRSLWPMPQWILFLGVPALTIWGAA